MSITDWVNTIEKAIPKDPGNPLHIAIYNLLLLVGKDLLAKESDKEEIPSSFIPKENFSTKWLWAWKTVERNLKDTKVYANPEFIRFKNVPGRKPILYVNEFKVLSHLASKGTTNKTKFHAQRNLDMQRQIDELNQQRLELEKRNDN